MGERISSSWDHFDPFLVKNLSGEQMFLYIHLCLVGWVARSEDTYPTQGLRNSDTVKSVRSTEH